MSDLTMIMHYKTRTGLWKPLFALAEIIDGIVILISLGQLKTELPLTVAKYQARASHNKAIREYEDKG